MPGIVSVSGSVVGRATSVVRLDRFALGDHAGNHNRSILGDPFGSLGRCRVDPDLDGEAGGGSARPLGRFLGRQQLHRSEDRVIPDG